MPPPLATNSLVPSEGFTALFSDMLDESPFFMDFFAKGDAITLAHGLRAALDAMS